MHLISISISDFLITLNSLSNNQLTRYILIIIYFYFNIIFMFISVFLILIFEVLSYIKVIRINFLALQKSLAQNLRDK